jgi:hypothetical protein
MCGTELVISAIRGSSQPVGLFWGWARPWGHMCQRDGIHQGRGVDTDRTHGANKCLAIVPIETAIMKIKHHPIIILFPLKCLLKRIGRCSINHTVRESLPNEARHPLAEAFRRCRRGFPLTGLSSRRWICTWNRITDTVMFAGMKSGDLCMNFVLTGG